MSEAQKPTNNAYREGWEIAFGSGEVQSCGVTVEYASDHGTVCERVEGETDGNLKIAFNGQFLADCLKAVEGIEARLQFVGPLSPAKITGDGETFAVLMPLRQ